jgi:hypothetical protein
VLTAAAVNPLELRRELQLGLVEGNPQDPAAPHDEQNSQDSCEDAEESEEENQETEDADDVNDEVAALRTALNMLRMGEDLDVEDMHQITGFDFFNGA